MLIRPSALGDVCRTVPVLASLRAAFPRARIDWLVRDQFGDAVRAHPALSNVIDFPRQRVALSRLATREGRTALAALLRTLRRAEYDLVLDCQGLGRSGLFAAVTRAPRRVGFTDAREFGWLGLTQRVRTSPRLHTVDRMLALVEAAGAPAGRDMRLYAPEPAAEFADRTVDRDPALVIAPTSAWPGKRWPAERFNALARAVLAQRLVERVVIVGGPGERDQCEPLLELAGQDPRVVDLVGRTSVAQLMGIIERAALVVANDSAAVHIAVGFDRPLVALYGPTRIDLVGPYRREHDVIQAVAPRHGNEHKDERAGAAAMGAIPLERVVLACEQRLQPAAHRTTGPAPVPHA